MTLHRRLWLTLAVSMILLPGCRESAPDDLIQAETTTEALVFVKTEGEETLNRSREAGNLYRLSPISPFGVLTPITNFTGASISDPCVSFDGNRILFSMQPPDDRNRNIFEIHADGSSLRQITRNGGDDFDPLYLPNGQILFTSSRAGEMDEYNRSPTEHLFTCDEDGTNITRISFNQSDDFDPTLMPDGRIVYTRWEHFGTINRFPLFFTNPDGTQTFHKFGPHDRNFFHPQPMADGRIIAIESSRVNEDAGPIAVLKLEMGPADPAAADSDHNWDVITPAVNNSGAPWPRGSFKFPFPLGNNRYVVSYSLPSATERDVDYGLYTFGLSRTGAGTDDDPATITITDLTFLYNDPTTNEFDAQLIAARPKPPIVETLVDPSVDFGVFAASDVFNRGLNDGQEVPIRGKDIIDKLAVFVGIPTARGEPNNISANEFEKRALLGFAPVYEDGSFRIKVPADTPISFATLDEIDRAIVNKRTWIYVRPGEEVNKCTGCHKDRGQSDDGVTNPNPYALTQEPSDLNVRPEDYVYINYRDQISPIVETKCASCHFETYQTRDTLIVSEGRLVSVLDTIPPPGFLDLTSMPDTVELPNRIFPRGYVNLSGESETSLRQAVVPVFPRRSILIDYILGVGSREGQVPHPEGVEFALTEEETTLFKFWVMLGAQYR